MVALVLLRCLRCQRSLTNTTRAQHIDIYYTYRLLALGFRSALIVLFLCCDSPAVGCSLASTCFLVIAPAVADLASSLLCAANTQLLCFPCRFEASEGPLVRSKAPVRCIPLLLLLFAIYLAVAALCGLGALFLSLYFPSHLSW